MRRKKKYLSLLVIISSLLLLSTCSINKLAVKVLANSLSSGEGGAVFTGDEDPELVGEALPFALKLYEMLLQQSPDNAKLLLTTALGFTLYANVYVQTPASMLPGSEFETQEQMLARAKRLYLRARRYIFRAIELNHPGFLDLMKDDQLDSALAATDRKDVPYLYVAGASWLGAFTTDSFDMELLISLPQPLAILQRALEIDEEYMKGTLHDLFISIFGSIPAAMGGSEEKARFHFQRAVEISGGVSASPYVALATSIAVKNQNVEEFELLLNQALAIDLDNNPDNRLMNTLNQRKARWLLDHEEDFFLLDTDFEEEGN